MAHSRAGSEASPEDLAEGNQQMDDLQTPTTVEELARHKLQQAGVDVEALHEASQDADADHDALNETPDEAPDETPMDVPFGLTGATFLCNALQYAVFLGLTMIILMFIRIFTPTMLPIP